MLIDAKGGLFIAQKRGCLCSVATAFDVPGIEEDVIEWLREGMVVTYEESGTFTIGQCPHHPELLERPK